MPYQPVLSDNNRHNTQLNAVQILLTFLKLVCQYHQESHRDHEEVEDKADLTKLSYGRPTHMPHHRLVCALSTNGGGVAQDDQSTNKEHK